MNECKVKMFNSVHNTLCLIIFKYFKVCKYRTWNLKPTNNSKYGSTPFLPHWLACQPWGGPPSPPLAAWGTPPASPRKKERRKGNHCTAIPPLSQLHRPRTEGQSSGVGCHVTPAHTPPSAVITKMYQISAFRTHLSPTLLKSCSAYHKK